MKVIEYYRVSTGHQSKSGLGLESQEAAVKHYIQSTGATSIGRFEEVESAGSKDRVTAHKALTIDSLIKKRPVLQQVIKLAQETGATILVKEPSRLSRFSLLIDYLIATKVHFIATDNPNDSEFFIKMRTLFNEDELTKVSERTTKALHALKARGKLLGKPDNFNATGRLKGALKRSSEAQEDNNNRQVTRFIVTERKLGKTLNQIATELNELGYKTSRGKQFSTGTIDMYIKRTKSKA